MTNKDNAIATFIYDLSGKLLAELPGGLPNFSADGQTVIVYSSTTGKNYLYDSSGNLLTEFDEEFSGFSVGRAVFTTASQQTHQGHLYDFSGRELVQLEGQRIDFAPDGERIVTTLLGTSKIYRLLQ